MLFWPVLLTTRSTEAIDATRLDRVLNAIADMLFEFLGVWRCQELVYAYCKRALIPLYRDL